MPGGGGHLQLPAGPGSSTARAAHTDCDGETSPARGPSSAVGTGLLLTKWGSCKQRILGAGSAM